MPTLPIGDNAIFYARRRRAAPHTLVLVHGAGGDHTDWGCQLAGVRAASVYAVDLPGHGRSGGAARQSVSQYAEDVLRMLDALHVERPIVGGVSMGGAVAMTLALSHPERVAGLVLASTGARLRVGPSLLDALRTDFPRGVDMLVEAVYSPNAAPGLVERGRRRWLATRPGVILDDFLACDAFDIRDVLGRITCPTLVVCGTEDRMTPSKYAAYLRDHIERAELRLIEGAGHLAMIEQPEMVNEFVDEFVQTLKQA